MAKELNQQEITERVNVLIDGYPSVRAFAMKVGIDPGNLTKKRAGGQPWTINDIKKICNAIGTSKDWLIDGVGDMYVSVVPQSIAQDDTQANTQDTQANTQGIPNIADILPNIPVKGNKQYYLDIVMRLFERYMDNEQSYQEIIKENQKIMEQITIIYNKIKER
jgi:hypothetical protein